MSSSGEQAPTPAEWLEANPGASEAERKAVTFLDTMEKRDLEASEAAIASGFTMVFPGAARYTRLRDLVEGAKGRYRWVAKRIEGVDSGEGESGPVVWVRGTLYGENVTGVAFEGVRFTDRFGFSGGLLVSQDVWNDLAESGVLSKQP